MASDSSTQGRMVQSIALRVGRRQCEFAVGQTAHTPRHQNVAARRATAQLPASGRARSQRLPDALLWPLKFAENLSFRSASVVTHTHILRIARPRIHIVPAMAGLDPSCMRRAPSRISRGGGAAGCWRRPSRSPPPWSVGGRRTHASDGGGAAATAPAALHGPLVRVYKSSVREFEEPSPAGLLVAGGRCAEAEPNVLRV